MLEVGSRQMTADTTGDDHPSSNSNSTVSLTCDIEASSNTKHAGQLLSAPSLPRLHVTGRVPSQAGNHIALTASRTKATFNTYAAHITHNTQAYNNADQAAGAIEALMAMRGHTEGSCTTLGVWRGRQMAFKECNRPLPSPHAPLITDETQRAVPQHAFAGSTCPMI